MGFPSLIVSGLKSTDRPGACRWEAFAPTCFVLGRMREERENERRAVEGRAGSRRRRLEPFGAVWRVAAAESRGLATARFEIQKPDARNGEAIKRASLRIIRGLPLHRSRSNKASIFQGHRDVRYFSSSRGPFLR